MLVSEIVPQFYISHYRHSYFFSRIYTVSQRGPIPVKTLRNNKFILAQPKLCSLRPNEVYPSSDQIARIFEARNDNPLLFDYIIHEVYSTRNLGHREPDQRQRSKLFSYRESRFFLIKNKKKREAGTKSRSIFQFIPLGIFTN